MFLDEKNITIVALLVCVSVVAIMVRLEKRVRTDLQPSLVPTTPVLLAFGAAGIMALVHLLNLFGIHTGR